MSDTPTPVTNDTGGKYLTFRLDSEEYGIEILKAREIIGLMDITPVPRTPDYVRGVINLRGKIIPVYDMRQKFGMPACEDTVETCIIVVDIEVDATSTQIGILVDAVSEVLDIDGENIDASPMFGSHIEADFIRGIAKTDKGVIILLEVENALSTTDLNEASTLVASAD
ncbi:MAG: chemotaxis protein CheW [Phycisphaerales bacterium JB063]